MSLSPLKAEKLSEVKVSLRNKMSKILTTEVGYEQMFMHTNGPVREHVNTTYNQRKYQGYKTKRLIICRRQQKTKTMAVTLQEQQKNH